MFIISFIVEYFKITYDLSIINIILFLNFVGIYYMLKKIRISIYSSRPGIIIGKKGADIEDLKNKLTKLSNLEVFLDIKEIRKP